PILARQIILGRSQRAMAEVVFIGHNVNAASDLKRRPSFSESVNDPFAADGMGGTWHPFALVCSHALPAVEARPQHHPFDNPQQVLVGISLGVAEYQSLSRIPPKAGADAHDPLLRILHLPTESLLLRLSGTPLKVSDSRPS